MTALEILQQAKDEVAKNEGYTSWDHVVVEYYTNEKSPKSIEQMLEEASLLAMERIADQTWNRAHKSFLSDKSTYMNNLFPKL